MAGDEEFPKPAQTETSKPASNSPFRLDQNLPVSDGVVDLSPFAPKEVSEEMKKRIEEELKTEGTHLEGLTQVQIEQAAEKEELRKHMEETGVDPITGLNNRLKFDAEFPAIFGNAFRSKTPLSVLYIDVDRLKEVNDRFGHGAGDALLKRVGLALKAVFHRDSDFLVRLGGDEFFAALPFTSNEDAFKLSEKLLDVFQDMQDLNGPIVNTLSIGLSTQDGSVPIEGLDGPNREQILMEHRGQLITESDKAMYTAKKISHQEKDTINSMPDGVDKANRLRQFKGHINKFKDLEGADLSGNTDSPPVENRS